MFRAPSTPCMEHGPRLALGDSSTVSETRLRRLRRQTARRTGSRATEARARDGAGMASSRASPANVPIRLSFCRRVAAHLSNQRTIEMADNFGPGVSRILASEGTQYIGTVWQQGKPPCDSELNLMQSLALEAVQSSVLRGMPSGFLGNETNPQRDFLTNPTWSNFYK